MLKNLLTVAAIGLAAFTASAGSVWEGSFDCGNWKNLEVPASYTVDLKAGDKITVYFTVNAGSEYGQMVFKDGDWNELEALTEGATGKNPGEYSAWPANATVTVLTPTADAVAAIAATGFIISGQNVTVTKIAFGESDSGSTGGGTGGGSTATGDNVWTGSFDCGNWKNLEIPASYTVNLKAGDKITVYFTVNAGNEYGQMVFKDGDWNELEALTEGATGKNPGEFSAWPANATVTVLTPTADAVAAIAATGFIISGQNVTVTKVVFGEATGGGNTGGDTPGTNPGGDVTGDNVWTGSFDCGNWKNLEVPASYTVNLKAGDKITVYFTINEGKEYGQMVFKDGDWNELEALTEGATGKNPGEYSAWPANATVTVLTCSAEDAAAIAATGFIISGQNVTVTKVVFGEATGGGNTGGDTPGTNPGGDVTGDNVWTGSYDCGNWKNLEIPASYTVNLKAGDKITVYFTINEGKEYGQMVFKDGDWNELEALTEGATGKNPGEYSAWPANATVTVLTCSAEDAAAIAATGFIISGQNVTVTKVVFGEATGGNGGGNTGGDVTGANVWTGSYDCGNWKNLEIPASYTVNLKAGDDITVYFTVNEGKDYGQMVFKDGDWNELEALTEGATGKNPGEYSAWPSTATVTKLSCSAEDAAAIAATGFIISGQNVTITKVVFGSATNAVEMVIDNSNAPVEYYNLQGVRLSEPAAGTIVIRRQGTDVKKVIF